MRAMSRIVVVIVLALFALAGCGGGGGGTTGGGGGGNNSGEPRPGDTVKGTVIDESTGLGVPGVKLLFYAASGALVDTDITDDNGKFSKDVDVDATQFHVDNASVPAGYFKSYNFKSKTYTTLDATCRAPLPPLSQGTLTTLPAIRLSPTSGPPPPPPTGCG